MKGYQRRHVLMYQLQRMQVWASMFCMGNPEKKSPIDIFHLYFDDWDKETVPVDEDTVKDLQAAIAAENRRIARQNIREAKRRKAKRKKKG